MFPAFVLGADEDVQNHWNRMTSADSKLRADLSTLITSLKSKNLWNKIGILCVAHDNSADSLLNLKGLGSGAPDSTLAGSPTFTADRGFTCTSTTKVVDLGVTETSASLYALNDAHFMNYTRTDPISGTQFALFSTQFPDDSGILRYQSTTSVSIYLQSLIVSVTVAGVSDQKGFFGGSIISSSNRVVRINDTIASNSGTLSGTLNTANFICFGGDSATSETTQHTAWGLGSAFSASELGLYEDSIRSYMQARGADVY